MRMHKNGVAFCMYKIEMGYKEPQAKESERSQGSPQESLGVFRGEKKKGDLFQ